MKFDGEIMEILEAYDLTGSLRSAAELTGCSHHGFNTLRQRLTAPTLTATQYDVSGHAKLPIGGHGTAHWRPAELPVGGHEICPLLVLSPTT